MSELPYLTPLTQTPSDYAPIQEVWEFSGKCISLTPELNTLSLGAPGLEPLEIYVPLQEAGEEEQRLVEEIYRLTVCRIVEAFVKQLQDEDEEADRVEANLWMGDDPAIFDPHWRQPASLSDEQDKAQDNFDRAFYDMTMRGVYQDDPDDFTEMSE